MYFLLPLFLANAHCMATGNMPGHRWYPTERSPSSTLSFASDPNPYNLGTSKSHVAVTCCSSIKLSAFMQRIKCQLRGPFLCVCLLRHSWLHSNQWHSRNWWSHSRVSESPCMCSVYHKHPLSCSKTRMHLAVSHIVRAFYFSCWKTLIFFLSFFFTNRSNFFCIQNSCYTYRVVVLCVAQTYAIWLEVEIINETWRYCFIPTIVLLNNVLIEKKKKAQVAKVHLPQMHFNTF